MDSSITYNEDDTIDSHLTKTQRLELAYQENVRNTEMIIKDECARRLRLRILLLENENDELHEQLAVGDDRNDILEQTTTELRNQLSDIQEDFRRQECELRVQGRELNNLKAELTSMNGITTDSAKVLADKLSLSRELATLKPELEHLRSQASSQQNVLAEKLALQRQVNTLEVELETEKRASKRAAQKSQTSERENELQNQLDTLQKDLARERREQAKARKEVEMDIQIQLDEAQKALTREKRGKEKAHKEAEAELQNQIEELQKELAKEKRGKDKAYKEVEAELQIQVEELQKDLTKEKKGKAKARNEAETELQNQVEELQKELAREKRGQDNSRKELESEYQSQIDEIKSELAHEKREMERVRKETEKELNVLQARETVLESKLEQFRTKLRATKEELKASQVELSNARAVKSGSTAHKEDAPANKRRKRGALEISNDGEIGTPDGVAARGKRAPVKRGRADQTMVGEKSMFSITPFLNRTANIAMDTPENETNSVVAEEEDELEGTEGQQQEKATLRVEDGASTPSAVAKPKPQKKLAAKSSAVKSKILGESNAGAKNRKPAPKKVAKIVSTLEQVAEEEDEENEQPDVGAIVPSKAIEKPRKLINSKASKLLAKDVNSEDGGAKKKKRKLLGGGKTLFEEEDGEVAKRPAKVALGPARLLGKGALPGPKGLNSVVAASSGSGAFSPLKKDRRGVGASFLA
ncbi:related to USO1 Intracellular protein transport protein [Rhynchosporium secalis]|uniref:Related to USO1 Intracellular protein transport protein n=1 Tax=Rhynchosporium secalis TaxID=38038 RepID=A0A1E1LXG7_RHYSE|nr:related to USO1 Intracellular protein transport protein [Rhynchosporium secalis]